MVSYLFNVSVNFTYKTHPTTEKKLGIRALQKKLAIVSQQATVVYLLNSSCFLFYKTLFVKI